MLPSSVVMKDPLPKNDSKMALGHRNQTVQTLATNRPDETLAKGVGL